MKKIFLALTLLIANNTFATDCAISKTVMKDDGSLKKTTTMIEEFKDIGSNIGYTVEAKLEPLLTGFNIMIFNEQKISIKVIHINDHGLVVAEKSGNPVELSFMGAYNTTYTVKCSKNAEDAEVNDTSIKNGINTKTTNKSITPKDSTIIK